MTTDTACRVANYVLPCRALLAFSDLHARRGSSHRLRVILSSLHFGAWVDNVFTNKLKALFKVVRPDDMAVFATTPVALVRLVRLISVS